MPQTNKTDIVIRLEQIIIGNKKIGHFRCEDGDQTICGITIGKQKVYPAWGVSCKKCEDRFLEILDELGLENISEWDGLYNHYNVFKENKHA